MPLMTKPFAHLEMLVDEIKHRIATLSLEAHKIDARIAELTEIKWKAENALDEERKKIPQTGCSPTPTPGGDSKP